MAVFLLAPGRPGECKPASSALAGQCGFDKALMHSPAGIEALRQFARNVGASAIATLAESNGLWLAQSRDAFEPTIRLLLPPARCLETLASKARQIELACEAGFELLPTYTIRRLADIEAIAPGDYPLALRPDASAAATEIFRVKVMRSAAELRRVLGGLDLERCCILAQPFLSVPNLVLHCSSREGRLLTCDAFLADRMFEAVALRLRPLSLPAGLREKAARFAALTGLCGAYHLDMLYQPKKSACYFLEVNARLGGTTDKVLRLGLDEPANCLRAYGLCPPRPLGARHDARARVVNKRTMLKQLLTALWQAPQPWDYPAESRLRSALHSLDDLLFAADSVFDWHDLRGVINYQLQRG